MKKVIRYLICVLFGACLLAACKAPVQFAPLVQSDITIQDSANGNTLPLTP